MMKHRYHSDSEDNMNNTEFGSKLAEVDDYAVL